eukprot:8555743-Alexandrium_andersonii.AAC.1
MPSCPFLITGDVNADVGTIDTLANRLATGIRWGRQPAEDLSGPRGVVQDQKGLHVPKRCVDAIH